MSNKCIECQKPLDFTLGELICGDCFEIFDVDEDDELELAETLPRIPISIQPNTIINIV